jgi:phospholipase C
MNRRGWQPPAGQRRRDHEQTGYMDRRTFLKASVAGAGLAGAGATASAADLVNIALPSLGLTHPKPRTPVEKIVIVMMENRSVDHLLGWYAAENAAFDATQTASYPDLRDGGSGAPVATRNWGRSGRNNFHGRGFSDPGHGWDAGRVQFNGGACDGFLFEDSGNDEFALSYYDARDVPVWADIVRTFTTCDRYFCSVLGPTQPNRYYLYSGQSHGWMDNTLPPQSGRQEWLLGWDWPTILTLLDRAGVSWGWYFSNLPEIAFWGARHLKGVRHISNYFLDAALGLLPQVSFVDPWFLGVPAGVSNDDHPHADLRLGQEFIWGVTSAFIESPDFRRGALFLTYDEWGGFWDHVPPPRFPDDRASTNIDQDFAQAGFRVPTAVVSPWTQGGRVHHGVLEHASIIKFVAENWGAGYLTKRHRETTSIEPAFGNFQRYRPEADLRRYIAPLRVRLEPTLENLGLLSSSTPAAVSDLHRLAELGWFEQLGLRTDWRFEDSFREAPAAL